MTEQPQFTAEDKAFMAEAVRLGQSHNGLTGDNPSVGAVLVRQINGRAEIIGRGITALGGRPHAEPQALAEAQAQAKGAALYVTLEPCCHFGQTPPCTNALIKAGIARAVVALADPDSRVSGQGIAALRAAGIKVELGCLQEEAARSLAAYLCRRRFNRPFLTAKLAVSADGCIGRRGGGRIVLTGAPFQRFTHYLRAAHDAVLIGIGTALNDNPRLDCRCLAADTAQNGTAAGRLLHAAVLPRGAAALTAPLPVRLVMDTALRLPLDSNLAQSARRQPVWLLCGADAPAAKRRQLTALGCRIMPCALDQNGKIALPQMLEQLLAEGIKSALIEGGGEIIGAFNQQNLPNQLILARGAAIIGADGDKMPDFSRQTGYEEQATALIGADKAAVFLRLYGASGLLGQSAENEKARPICLPAL